MVHLTVRVKKKINFIFIRILFTKERATHCINDRENRSVKSRKIADLGAAC